jgi:hypothetical protein
MLRIPCLAVALVLAMTGLAFAQGKGAPRGARVEKGTGNGAQSGSHYNLNIIGHDQCPGDDLTGTNRHVIVVLLNGRSKILLAQGDFAVLDGNACDSNGATFQLPANPFTCPVTDPECLNTDPTFQEYLVFARALGAPGGSATITTCATDPVTLEVVCSTGENVLLVRSTGRSRFRNVTRELTTLCLDTDLDGVCDTRVPIFGDGFQGFFWDYDNLGLRLAQLRFYPLAD